MSLGLSWILVDFILLKISSGSVSYFGSEKWAQKGYVTRAWLPKFVKDVAVICVSICLVPLSGILTTTPELLLTSLEMHFHPMTS